MPIDLRRSMAGEVQAPLYRRQFLKSKRNRRFVTPREFAEIESQCIAIQKEFGERNASSEIDHILDRAVMAAYGLSIIQHDPRNLRWLTQDAHKRLTHLSLEEKLRMYIENSWLSLTELDEIVRLVEDAEQNEGVGSGLSARLRTFLKLVQS